MVVADDVGDVLVGRQVRQHLGALLGMLADVLPLLLVEGRGLTQHSVGNPHFAEVVK